MWRCFRRRNGFVALATSGLVALAASLPAIEVVAPTPRTPARIQAAMDMLVAAYPHALLRHDGKWLYWRKGPPSPIGDPARQRTAAAILAAPDIADIFAWPYPGAGTPSGDPGRARPAAFFTRLYGDCRNGSVETALVPVRWVGGRTVRFTGIAGAATALEKVARDLEMLGPSMTRYLWPISGTYNCRAIAGTDALSMHAVGAAIDLNSRFGRYWRWSPRPAARDAIPPAIIRSFERHGFIWGGNWAHFDSFHFEYRPELVKAAGSSVSR